MSTPLRVRFAPSPTGFLHVGGARTAIYNDLLAHKLGGVNILRIEDTDRQRSDEAMTRQIEDALRWVGVEWHEGPYLQSVRVDRHTERAQELLDEGRAYKAYETPEELDVERQRLQKDGETFRYREGRSPLSDEEIAAREASGAPFVVRFRMPSQPIEFTDLVRGDVEFSPEVFDDFILLRSDGSPTYHMSVVTDDIDMEVTHVIRGEDHLSNTPKHIGLFRALGAAVPTFGHLPMILGQDRKRLSKRTGAASVEEFRSQGILPQALYNYLTLLGWNPGDEREVMSREVLIEAFTTERLNDSAAVFDPEKLAWMNAQYMSSLPLDEILSHGRPFLESAGLADSDPERLAAVADLLRTRAKTLAELAELAVPYFEESLGYDEELTAKFRAQEELPGYLETLAQRYTALPEFDVESLETALRELADEVEVKAGVLIHPVRMALTGGKAGPPLFDVVELVGREATARRMEEFVRYLRDNPAPAAS